MIKVHRTPRNPMNWDMFFLDEDEFEAQKQRITQGSNEITFLPNYEYDEEGKLHIEDYSEIDNYYKVKEIERWMDCAAKFALNSLCQKCQRGAIVVLEDKIIGEACNGPAYERCNPCLRKEIHDNTQVERCKGVHAEKTAVDRALENIYKEGKRNLTGARLYYIKTRDGEIVPSGEVSCVLCSSAIFASGIEDIVMLRGDSSPKINQLARDPDSYFIDTRHFVIYTTRKFNELTHQYVSNLPN